MPTRPNMPKTRALRWRSSGRGCSSQPLEGASDRGQRGEDIHRGQRDREPSALGGRSGAEEIELDTLGLGVGVNGATGRAWHGGIVSPLV